MRRRGSLREIGGVDLERELSTPYLGWPGRHRLGLGQYLSIASYWFSNNMLWTGLLLIVLPAHVQALVGSQTATAHLSLVQGAGDVVAIICAPLLGALSDRATYAMGRRRPQMIVSAAGLVASLLFMGYARSFGTFLMAFVMIQFFSNGVVSAHQGLIPDLVPEEQRGTASGYLGLFAQGALLAGALAASRLAGAGFFWVTAAVVTAGMMVTTLGIKEPLPPPAEPFTIRRFLGQFLLDRRLYRDFWWVVITRFLVMCGLYVLEDFLYYYLAFVLHAKNPSADVFTVLLVITGTALLSVLTAGYLSDRLRRRRILVTVAGLLMGACALGFVLLGTFSAILVMAGVFGLGYGTYQSIDYALAVDTLPGTSSARDLGFWGLATTVPQAIVASLGLVVATEIIPWVGVANGYRVLFGVTFFLFLAGSVLIWKVRSVA